MKVHILKHGQSLCGLPGLPKDWPPDHRWVSFQDLHLLPQVNCEECQQAQAAAIFDPRGEPVY